MQIHGHASYERGNEVRRVRLGAHFDDYRPLDVNATRRSIESLRAQPIQPG